MAFLNASDQPARQGRRISHTKLGSRKDQTHTELGQELRIRKARQGEPSAEATQFFGGYQGYGRQSVKARGAVAGRLGDTRSPNVVHLGLDLNGGVVIVGLHRFGGTRSLPFQ